jgi:hypothetical protein
MIAEAAIFTCSICGERSSEICVFCTKDACSNHRCERCKRCSDCCECEIPLSAAEAPAVIEVEVPPEVATEPLPAPQMEPPPQESQEPAAAGPEPDSQSERGPAPDQNIDSQPPHPEHPIF